MASFAFLPRSIKANLARVEQARLAERTHTFPQGIVLMVQIKTLPGSTLDVKSLTSTCEKLVPRSCQYVHFDEDDEEKVKAQPD